MIGFVAVFLFVLCGLFCWALCAAGDKDDRD